MRLLCSVYEPHAPLTELKKLDRLNCNLELYKTITAARSLHTSLMPTPSTHPLALESRWRVWAQDYTTETVHVPCHMTHKNTTTFSGLGVLHEVMLHFPTVPSNTVITITMNNQASCEQNHIWQTYYFPLPQSTIHPFCCRPYFWNSVQEN